MKKHIALTLFISLSTLISKAQAVFEPSVVILYPQAVIANDTINREHDVYIKELEITEALRKSYVKEGLAKNWKIIREKELEFIKKQDFATLLTLTLSRELTYKELEHHENPLIFPVKEPLTNKLLYKSIAQKYHVTWVINILKVELSTIKKVKKMKLTLQTYNVIASRVMSDATFNADNTTTPDSCEAGGWLCLVENIKAAVAKDLEDKIEKSSHMYK
jgi:hypothetical protein